MSISIWIVTAVLVFHTVHSYILLTANIEDVRNIAKQVAASPVGDRMTQIVHRAWEHFKPHLTKISGKKLFTESEEGDVPRRTDDKKKKRLAPKDADSDTDKRVTRRNRDERPHDVEGGETYYRKSIDQIFDDV